MANETMSPVLLSRYLGQQFPPTEQQADVIGAEPGPLLVVAGAGAGKTETMAARVVWLVANGFARPEEVLGLTFTRKAAQELGVRIRDRLGVLASNDDLLRRLDPSGELAEFLQVIAPTVSTYDAYAGDLIREYGLFVPVEPDARLITEAELYAIARDVVMDHRGTLLSSGQENPSLSTAVDDVLELMTQMGNWLVDASEVEEHTRIFLAETEALSDSQNNATVTAKVSKWRGIQQLRSAYLPIVAELTTELRTRGLVTFNEQMSVAARLARDTPAVGQSQRQRFRVVMLDEYQDTSHAQRILLRSLFANAHSVTAVGDPMQAIYGWRGASVDNLGAFVDDFPQADGTPAPTKQLTTSWRNPPEVLELANRVSDRALGTGPQRAVAALTPRPGAPAGEVTIGFFEHEHEEIDYVADNLAKQYQETQKSGEPFSAAVLVRANKTSPLVADALERRGVPYEIVGLAGLLDVPEVADTIAIASMLVRPGDSAAALRILSGPAVGLGLKDIDALARRASNLRGSKESTPTHADNPLDHYYEQLDAAVDEAHRITAGADVPAGLTDAIADLGEQDRYSEEGLARLHELASKLRWLRTHSLGKRLPDVVADIISVFGIRTEVLSRPSLTGAVHLDRLLDEVASYPGTGLEGLLDYFELAKKREDGLAPGSVPVRSDRVQILTAHKAKGLEWDTVAVIRADEQIYQATVSTFLTRAKLLPRDDFNAFEEAGDQKDFTDAAEEYINTARDRVVDEHTRLFYVALTRSARKLIITGSARTPTRKKSAGPFADFEDIHLLVPKGQVVTWFDSSAQDSADDQPDSEKMGAWPHLGVEPEDADAAALVREAMVQLPERADGELFSLWERDVTALIEEHHAAQAAEVPVVLPGELTASDIVALKADPEQFARRARRPVPFKPNSYAKRGTAFHEWIEEFYHQRPLLSEDELPGHDEAEVDARTLALLKSNFEASHWANKTPSFVEHPFELALGNTVVRGRMDAVFQVGSEWVVVDWKTGSKPAPAQMNSAKLQLAVYREAWRRIADDGKPVRAVFFYVRTGEDFAPSKLPDGEELEQLLRESTQQAIEFRRESP